MPKKARNPDNGSILTDEETEAVTAFAERIGAESFTAANPADDFNPDLNLRKIIALNARVARFRQGHEEAKGILKEAPQYVYAKRLGEELKGAEAELEELLSELGREYPLFDRRKA